LQGRDLIDKSGRDSGRDGGGGGAENESDAAKKHNINETSLRGNKKARLDIHLLR
jgi:hypothetical protein